jgi:hypothetical protein
MAEISANLITTIHTKELQDSGLLVDSIDDRQIEMMQDLFKTIAFSPRRLIFKMGIFDGSSSKILGSTGKAGKSDFVLALSTASFTFCKASSTGILKSNLMRIVV